jgi:hypothetical protein
MGLISRIDLSAAVPAETFFASRGTNSLGGMATAGEYLYVANGLGRIGEHIVYRPNGTIVDFSARNTLTAAFTWSEANQKMYFLRQPSDSNQLNWEEVNASGNAYPGQSPGAIRNRFTSNGNFVMTPPIRLRPDGKVGLLGTGQVFDALSLSLVGSLPGFIHDARWQGSDLFAIRNDEDITLVQRLSGGTYELIQSIQLPGSAVSIQPLGVDRLIVVTQQPNSPPGLYVLATDLSTIKNLEGDSNYDGRVDLQDLNNVRNRFGGMGHGDADSDGDIDLDDLNAVRNGFGTAPATRAAFPPAMANWSWKPEIHSLAPSVAQQRPYVDASYSVAVDRIHEAEAVAWQRWQEASPGASNAMNQSSYLKARKSRRLST